MKKLSLIAISALLMASCASEPNKENTTETNTTQTSTEESCTYSYDQSSSKIKWTSFKTSDKVAVGGAFDTFTVNNTVSADNETAVFENASFEIITSSINSGNPGRDSKLISYFFNTMISTDTISGKVLMLDKPDNGKGTALIAITMNNMTFNQKAEFTLENDVLTLSATLILNRWDGNAAIETLNNECKDLHTGADGISLLWDEVDVEISTTLAKDCK